MEYDLYSNHWEEISLLHSEHLSAETLYIEQMLRWGMRHGREWGVAQIEEDDFQVYGAASNYEAALRFCKAITPRGYIVDIDTENALSLKGSNDQHQGSLVVVYLGVAVRKVPANTGSSQTGALLDRPTLQWVYELNTACASGDYDWIEVGRMRREGQAFARDENYFPPCVSLRSYPALRRISGEITRAAERALHSLRRATEARADGSEVSQAWLALVGVLAATLAPAAVLLDRAMSPLAYLERLATVMRGYHALLPLLPKADGWTAASDLLREVMKTLGLATLTAETRAGEYPNAASGMAPNGAMPSTLAQTVGARGLGEAERDDMKPGTLAWDTLELIRRALQALGVLFNALTPATMAQPVPAQARPQGTTVITRPDPVKKMG